MSWTITPPQLGKQRRECPQIRRSTVYSNVTITLENKTDRFASESRAVYLTPIAIALHQSNKCDNLQGTRAVWFTPITIALHKCRRPDTHQCVILSSHTPTLHKSHTPITHFYKSQTVCNILNFWNST